jgi:hypothetical protein
MLGSNQTKEKLSTIVRQMHCIGSTSFPPNTRTAEAARNWGAFLAKKWKDSSRYIHLDSLSKEANMTGNFRRGLSNDRNTATDEAMILSVDADVAPDTVRISLQWQGDHDIADFDLQRFGKVLRIQDETENTGWAIIERRFHARIAHTLPGWAMHESVCPLTAGDTIPLGRDLE